MDFEVEFDYPEEMSRNLLNPELLEITLNRDLFAADATVVNEGTVLYAEIPEQYKQSEIDEFNSFKENVAEPVLMFSIF